MKQKTSLLIDIFSDIYSFFSETVYYLSNDTLLYFTKDRCIKKIRIEYKKFFDRINHFLLIIE